MNDSVLERLRAEEKFDEAVEELLRRGGAVLLKGNEPGRN